jgi:hypothetical protein
MFSTLGSLVAAALADDADAHGCLLSVLAIEALRL